MKKIAFFLISFLFIPTIVLGVNLNIDSKHVYLYNVDRGEVIYQLDSNKQISIASMTKILTALVAIENIDDLDATVVMTYKDFEGLLAANASQAGFKVGDEVTYRDLLYGLMLPSGADAALALANNIAGSEAEFAKLMNKKVNELGLTNSNFVNTSGLDASGQYSTAKETAIILEAALENKDMRDLLSAKTYLTSDKKITFHNHTVVLAQRYNMNIDIIVGSKTGYTGQAGRCLASFAVHEGDTYILITAGATGQSSQLSDTLKIYNHFFENYTYVPLQTKGDKITEIVDENGTYQTILVAETIEMYLPIGTEIKTKFSGVDVLTYDLKVGDKIGSYEIYIDGELTKLVDVLLEKEIVKPEKFSIIKFIIKAIMFLVIIFVVLFILAAAFAITRRKIRRYKRKMKMKKKIRK